jgi:hypothetical protein
MRKQRKREYNGWNKVYARTPATTEKFYNTD